MAHHNEEQRSPILDGAGDETINKVIGARADDPETTTLAGRTHAVWDHEHAVGRVYPMGASSIGATGGVGAWTLGAFVEIVPASAITSKFHIHHVFIRNISAQDEYELVLYQGAGDVEIGRVPFEGIAGGKIDSVAVKVPIISANARIRAKIMTAGGGSRTAEFKLGYHLFSS